MTHPTMDRTTRVDGLSISFWADRAANEGALRRSLLSLATTSPRDARDVLFTTSGGIR